MGLIVDASGTAGELGMELMWIRGGAIDSDLCLVNAGAVDCCTISPLNGSFKGDIGELPSELPPSRGLVEVEVV